ncbi:MAG: efflux RND transporter periplasmic adaptor subunit [Bacteroidetes bacterium HGW-Bacteroidetes-2]|jgi:RND family efflux transporter MFP subunit|nr:MAG: efflux RND transporter periplasmic adaptor subunit [Bacteroidetes bacterium HGW-Bacteroidetes-2]
MKKIFYTLILVATLVACGNKNKQTIDAVIAEGNLEKMKLKQEQILKSYDSIGSLLRKIEGAINEKDTLKKYPLVTTFRVKDTIFNNFVAIQGNVETSQNILLFPEFQGILTRVYVKQGQTVVKGQLLAKIDDGGLSSQLEQLETRYELAKTTYERQERLWNQKIGSEIQFLQSKTTMDAAKSNVEQLRSQLGRTSVRAPFSGVIDEVITDQGQVVAPGGQALMRIVNLDDMYVKASIPENYIQSITMGSAVAITFPAISLETEGTIKSVGNYINPTNRTFQIEIDVPNKEKNIKPNLIANLQINDYSNAKALIIPSNAIQENARGDKYVYVLTDMAGENAKVIQTRIETGKKQAGFVEVLSGLKDGDVLVQEGAISLKDGIMVTTKPIN